MTMKREVWDSICGDKQWVWSGWDFSAEPRSSNSSKERWSWKDRDKPLSSDEFSLSIIRFSIAYFLSYSFQMLVIEGLIFLQMTWCKNIAKIFLHLKNDSSLAIVSLLFIYYTFICSHFLEILISKEIEKQFTELKLNSITDYLKGISLITQNCFG